MTILLVWQVVAFRLFLKDQRLKNVINVFLDYKAIEIYLYPNSYINTRYNYYLYFMYLRSECVCVCSYLYSDFIYVQSGNHAHNVAL